MTWSRIHQYVEEKDSVTRRLAPTRLRLAATHNRLRRGWLAAPLVAGSQAPAKQWSGGVALGGEFLGDVWMWIKDG